MTSLNKKEQEKLEVIQKVITKEITKKEAALKLNVTPRHINRLIAKYQQEGADSFIHKSRGKESEKRTDENIKEQIVELYVNEYFDYNFKHFYNEAIKGRFDISYANVCNILNEHDIISPEAHHKTIKLYNEEMKKSIKNGEVKEEQITIYKERLELEQAKHVRRSSLQYDYGQEVQMDAALYIWFGEIATMLHLAVDKATKRVLAGWFDHQETSKAYYNLLWSMIINFGIPELIKTDRRGCFSVNNCKQSNSDLNITQFGRICADIGIRLKSNSDPTFKPNVERENRTFKGRLKAELRHEHITTIEEANKYLNEVFIPKVNSEFAYEINENKNIMKDNTFSKSELNIIISERYVRRIDNASSIKYKNNYYVLVDNDTGDIITFPKGTECTVVIAYDETLWCYINENLYFLLRIESYQEKNKEDEKKLKQEPKYKGHKPAPDHPWRSFKI